MAKNKPTTNKSKKNETKVTVKSAKTVDNEAVAKKEMDKKKVEEAEIIEAEEVEETTESEEVEETNDTEEVERSEEDNEADDDEGDIEEENEDDDEEEDDEEEDDEEEDDEEEDDEDNVDSSDNEEVEEVKAENISEEEIKEAETIVEEAKTCCEKSEENETGLFKAIFTKKCDASENILTIFHQKKIYGALIGEVFGTFVLTLVLLTLGAYQPLYIFFVVLGIAGATYTLSGANCNPLITAGLMASRRMSGIRGVLYILAQIFGAWLAYIICTSFVNTSEGMVTLPTMATVETNMFWTVTIIEFLGSLILAFFFARAIKGKKDALKFAGIYAGGAVAAYIIAIVISGNFLGLQNNFMMNPAIALMYQILPAGGDDIVELLSDIGLALTTYMVFPMIAGWLGFLISDIADYFAEFGDKCDSECKCCEK